MAAPYSEHEKKYVIVIKITSTVQRDNRIEIIKKQEVKYKKKNAYIPRKPTRQPHKSPLLTNETPQKEIPLDTLKYLIGIRKLYIYLTELNWTAMFAEFCL